jgi:hypothetical protein
VETFVDQQANIVRNLKYDKAVFKIPISNTNTRARNAIRNLARITGIPQTTVFRYFKLKKIFFSIIQVPRPKLTPWHCQNRVRYYRSQIAPAIEAIAPHYEAQYHTFHLDKKWFYVDKL